METAIKKKLKTILFEQWEAEGQPCSYVRFHAPLAPAKDREPQYEFRLEGKDKKYIVDKITCTEHGLVWRANGEIDFTGLATIALTRSIQ